MQPSPRLLSPVSWGKRSVCSSPHAAVSPFASPPWAGLPIQAQFLSGSGQCPVLPHLNPKLHFFLVPENDVNPAPTAETTEHPHQPPSSQEDETTSSSERTSVSAALGTAPLYQRQDGAHISFPSSHPSTVPIPDLILGVSAWFLAPSTPCSLTGECVIADVYVYFALPQQR